MKAETCCFTGHREIPEKDCAALGAVLEREIEKLIMQGVKYFGAGGALGFDTMAASAVIKLREKHPQIRLILVLPCKEQTRGWKESDVEIYNKILSKADKVVYSSEHYHQGCMHKRNRHLVDASDFCISYLTLTQNTGGTAYTVNYAKTKGLKVINLEIPKQNDYC